MASGGCWAGDEAFCYLTVDDAWRPDKLWRHRLGDTGEDELLHTEPDERFWLGVDSSRDNRWVQLGAASKTSTETWLLDATDPAATLRSVAPRRDDIEYDVEVAGDRLFIVHNDGAPDFALAQAPLTCTDAAEWTPIWAGEPGVRLLGVVSYDRVLVQSLRRDGLQVVTLRHRDAAGDVGAEVGIDFDEPIYTVDVDGGDEADTDRIRLHYQSMVTPDEVIDYRIADGDAHRPAPPAGARPPGPRPLPAHRLPAAAGVGRRRGRHPHPDLAGVPGRHPAGRQRRLPALRLRRLRDQRVARRSRSRGSACSTAATSTPSPTCAAAASSAAPGTPRPAGGQGEHLHRLRQLRAPPGVAPATPAPTGSPRRAAAPAGC